MHPDLPDDIPALARAAKAASAYGHGVEADRLWAAVFRLPHWSFLMTPKSVERMSPSVQLIDGKSWLLAFTDTALLQRYAAMNRNLDAAGNTLFLSIPEGGLHAFLTSSRDAGVFGVRFNEGDEAGFYAPMANLEAFPRYLREKGYGPIPRA